MDDAQYIEWIFENGSVTLKKLGWWKHTIYVTKLFFSLNDIADDDYDDDNIIIIDDNNIMIIINFSASSLAVSLYRFDTSSQFFYTALYKM